MIYRERFKDVGIVREFMEISDSSTQKFKLLKSGINVYDAKDVGCIIMEEFKSIAKETNLIHLNFNMERGKLILIGTKEQIIEAKLLISRNVELSLIFDGKMDLLISGWMKLGLKENFIPQDIVKSIDAFYPLLYVTHDYMQVDDATPALW